MISERQSSGIGLAVLKFRATHIVLPAFASVLSFVAFLSSYNLIYDCTRCVYLILGDICSKCPGHKKHTIIVVLCSDMIVCCDASVEGISYFEWWFRGALI